MTITVHINGQSYEANEGSSIIQVADRYNIPIPRFCYHSHLSVAGNCRMCLVEVQGSSKPIPSCVTLVTDGMVINTQSPKTQDAQKSVMEFLLINHPLDCPICDQGGECELQDLAVAFGQGSSQYHEEKRVVDNPNLGSLIATDMTRCIHCTRCIRFTKEVAGQQELGAMNRGEHMKIGTYLEHHIMSELSGNLIDVCPVGALTSKPNRYKGRSWEMKSVPGLSFFDGAGSTLDWNFKKQKLLRTLPGKEAQRAHPWISDRDRFGFLGHDTNRLNTPLMKTGDLFSETSWGQAFSHLDELLNSGQSLIGLIHPSLPLELSRDIQQMLIEHQAVCIDYQFNAQSRHVSPTFVPEEKLFSGSILVIGEGLTLDEPILSMKLRLWGHQTSHQLLILGAQSDPFHQARSFSKLTSPGSILSQMKCMLSDGYWKEFDNSETVNIILSPSLQTYPDYEKIAALAFELALKKGGETLILQGAHSAGQALVKAPWYHAQDWSSALANHPEANVLMFGMNAKDFIEEKKFLKALKKKNKCVIFASHFDESLKSYADLLMPFPSLVEFGGTHVNSFGQLQQFDSSSSQRTDNNSYNKSETIKQIKAWLGEAFPIKKENIFRDYVPVQPRKSMLILAHYDAPEINLITLLHPYYGHELLREAKALHQSALSQEHHKVFVSQGIANHYNLSNGDKLEISSLDHESYVKEVKVDNTLEERTIIQWKATEIDLPLTGSLINIKKVI